MGKLVPTTSASQRSLEGVTSAELERLIQQGLEPYTGQIVPDVPEAFGTAFNKFTSGEFSDEITRATEDLIAGRPAYEFDPKRRISEWEDIYATPVMQAYQNIVLPMVRESFNIPGVAYSRDIAKGTRKAAGDFYGQFVAPKLFESLQAGEQMGFQSGELAAGRRADALDIPYKQFAGVAGATDAYMDIYGRDLAAAYAEYARVQGLDVGILGTAGQLATTPTLQYIASSKKKSGVGSALGLAAGIGASIAFPGLGAAMGGMTAFELGILGAGVGGGL